MFIKFFFKGLIIMHKFYVIGCVYDLYYYFYASRLLKQREVLRNRKWSLILLHS